MADISDEIKTYLKTVSAVTTLVGAGTASRIFRDTLRQGATLPAIVLVEAGGGEVARSLTSLSGAQQINLHVYCYGATRSSANAVDAAVFSAFCGSTGLNGRGTMGTTGVLDIDPIGRFYEQDNSQDKQESPQYITRRVYLMWHVMATT